MSITFAPYVMHKATLADLAVELYHGTRSLKEIKLQYSPFVSVHDDDYHRFRIRNAKSVWDIEHELRSRVVVAWIEGKIEWAD